MRKDVKLIKILYGIIISFFDSFHFPLASYLALLIILSNIFLESIELLLKWIIIVMKCYL